MVNGWDQRVCLAAAFFLSDLTTGERSSVRVVEVPENRTREDGQKVELVCLIGTEEFAFEHTQIESYEGQIQDGHHISDFTEKVNEALSAPLPEGTFTLQLETDAVAGLKGKGADSAVAELASWIDKNAPDLAKGYDDLEPGSGRLDIESPIEGRLWFRPGETPRELRFTRSAPHGLEEERCKRIKRAYRDKLPKLASEREKGRTRCLVLEDRDISLANAILTRSATINAFEGFQDLEPEWIVLVETGIEPSQWIVLLSHGEWPELDLKESSAIEVPTDLECGHD